MVRPGSKRLHATVDGDSYTKMIVLVKDGRPQNVRRSERIAAKTSSTLQSTVSLINQSTVYDKVKKGFADDSKPVFSSEDSETNKIDPRSGSIPDGAAVNGSESSSQPENAEVKSAACGSITQNAAVSSSVSDSQPEDLASPSSSEKTEPSKSLTEKSHDDKIDNKTSDKTASSSEPDLGKTDSQTTEKCIKTDAAEENAVEENTTEKNTVDNVSQRLDHTFYNRPCEDLAKALLGQKIVRMVDGVRISAVIVETEAYLGAIDKAAHSYKGKTDRNKAMFMQPGTAYVYNIYGMYCCLNISSQGEGAAVLIRSVEPKEGVDKMMQLRSEKSGTKKQLRTQDLGNGPSKLCQSLGITKADVNQKDLVTDAHTWLEKGEEEIGAEKIVVSQRINVDYAQEWTAKPLRWYVLDNSCVSVRDKKAEEKLRNEEKGGKDSGVRKMVVEVKSKYFSS